MVQLERLLLHPSVSVLTHLHTLSTACGSVQDAAAADRALPDFRRSSHILDLAALDAEEARPTDEGSGSGGARASAAVAALAAGRAAAPQLEYSAAEVAGYAATRLPACYAALVKVSWSLMPLVQ